MRFLIPRLRRADSVLLVIDAQQRLMQAMPDSSALIARCTLLARAASLLEIPVIVTEQNPQRLGPTCAEIASALPNGQFAPHSKMQFSACTEATQSTLSGLREEGRRSVVLCGVEAHICVLQSALDLLEDEWEVFVSNDAIASRRTSDCEAGWDRMLRAGALPTSSESAIYEWLGEAGTPEFKALLPFLKA